MKGREAEEKSSLPLKGMIDPSLVDVGKLQEEALARVTSAVYRIPPLPQRPRLSFLSALAQESGFAYCGSANYGMSPPCVYMCVHVCMCIWLNSEQCR